MPNWCEGTLKVRGKVKDLKKFCLEGLHPVSFFGVEKQPLQLNEYDTLVHKGDCWIENSYRGFVENPEVCFGDFESDEDEEIIYLDSKFAWGIQAERLVETCKKYNVDMRIYAFERGMEFNQEVEIVNGVITKNVEITFDDYQWECIAPELGG